MKKTQTCDLLERWAQGDSEALNTLLERDLDWIRGYVHRRMGKRLRRQGDTDDFVQEAALNVLRHGPRFVLSSRVQFRALMAKIVLNVLRAGHRRLHALKRSPQKEHPFASDSTLYLDPPRRTVTTPSQAAQHEEEKEWLRLGLLLLEPIDQEVIDLDLQDLSDVEIGNTLGIEPNTARMRRVRGIARLTKTVMQLKNGRIEQILEPMEEERSQEGS